MFKNATKLQYDYLTWIKFIHRKYENLQIEKGSASLFFVNEEGWAITCKHVIETIMAIDTINKNYEQFKSQLSCFPDKKSDLEIKFKLSKNNVCQGAYEFGVNVKINASINCIMHPSLDIALIHFDVSEPTKYCYFVDNMNDIDQGTSLARIGFPFVDFNNYTFNPANETLQFTQNNKPMVTFVNDGIVSQNRYTIINNVQLRTHLLLSTPGIKGQSGGPLYDVYGRVAGMQSQTETRDLDFMGKSIINGKQIETPQFLNVGICISAEAIKDFLQKNNINYYIK